MTLTIKTLQSNTSKIPVHKIHFTYVKIMLVWKEKWTQVKWGHKYWTQEDIALIVVWSSNICYLNGSKYSINFEWLFKFFLKYPNNSINYTKTDYYLKFVNLLSKFFFLTVPTWIRYPIMYSVQLPEHQIPGPSGQTRTDTKILRYQCFYLDIQNRLGHFIYLKRFKQKHVPA